jgi:hypothetical protein
MPKDNSGIPGPERLFRIPIGTNDSSGSRSELTVLPDPDRNQQFFRILIGTYDPNHVFHQDSFLITGPFLGGSAPIHRAEHDVP